MQQTCNKHTTYPDNHTTKSLKTLVKAANSGKELPANKKAAQSFRLAYIGKFSVLTY